MCQVKILKYINVFFTSFRKKVYVILKIKQSHFTHDYNSFYKKVYNSNKTKKMYSAQKDKIDLFMGFTESV